MPDELNESPNVRRKPMLAGSQSFSLDEILRRVDPAPDEETEAFRRFHLCGPAG